MVHKIVETAREWLDTPFIHQGRVKGAGVDCAGLIVEIAKACGYQYHDVKGYSRIPHKQMLQQHIDQDLEKITELEEGCILLMSFDSDPQHLAIYTADDTIIHSYYQAGKCVEHRLDSVWRARVRGIYRYRK